MFRRLRNAWPTTFLIQLIVAVLLLSSLTDARAQVQTVNNQPVQFNSWRATTVALAPAATATDFMTIAGVAGRAIRVRRLHCDGTSTSAGTILIQVVKRSAVDTGGTSTTPLAVELNAAAAATRVAVLLQYTANPGALGTSLGNLAAQLLTTGTTTAASPGVDFNFDNQFVFLNSAADQVALNANGVSFPAGSSINCWIEWSE